MVADKPIIITDIPAVHATVRCDYCSHSKPEWSTKTWGGGMRICFDCDLRRQRDQDDFILSRRSVPIVCYRCRASLTDPPTPYYVVWADNTHQHYCARCNEWFYRMRRDVYHRHTIVGAKL